MIVSIHQPHFLPWMGYFNKVLHSDVFVWLHSVQYRKNYFQNRTKIKNVNGEPLWLTLPVHAKSDMNIDEVTIADARWRDRIHRTVEQCYRKTPYFAECWPVLSAALTRAQDTLDDVNYQTFVTLLQMLDGAHVRVVRAEEIPLSTTDPTRRLVEICTSLGASHYIAGKGGHNYMEAEEFEKAGIGVIWQDFNPESVVYPQVGDAFVPGLSMIDCIFNVGPVKARELAQGAWTP